jgi:hypothetical protein
MRMNQPGNQIGSKIVSQIGSQAYDRSISSAAGLTMSSYEGGLEMQKTMSDFKLEELSVPVTKTYNEMADVPVQMIDPIIELEKNLAHLQELQARMKFMMREVRYLIKM